MITKLSIKNFRLLRSVELDFEPGKPIVLIGPNSSGKTSVLEVLDFLRRAAGGGLASAWSSRGRPQTETANQMEIGVVVDPGRWAPRRRRFRGTRLSYRVELVDMVGVALHESLRVHGEPSEDLEIMSREDDDHGWILNRRTGSRDEFQPDGGKLAFEVVKQDSFYPELRELAAVLSSFRVHGEFLTTPLWVRDPREGTASPYDSAIPAPVTSLSRRGLDLVNSLYHVHSEQPAEWEDLIEAFRGEFPFVSRVEFPVDPSGGRIGLAWKDRRYQDVRFAGDQMSEGMLTYLCLLAAIFSAEHPTLLGFDEPELHLHPSALRRLVHLLEKKSFEIPVVVATHSDRFLDYLSDPAGSLRVCEPTKDGAVIKTIDRESLDEWRQDYTLSELRERGHIDPTNEGSAEIDA